MLARLGVTAAALCGACGFSVTAGGGGDGGPPGGEVTIVDDTAADFAENVELTGGVIRERGVIEPHAYVLGGLHARAYDGNLLDDDDTWDDAVAEAAGRTAYGAGYRQVPADWSADAANRPRGLGIPGTDSYTVHYEGELLLPAGMVTLTATADDRGIVQVALDGATFGERLFTKSGNAASITLAVPVAGWYPVRAALSQGGGDARFPWTITPPFGDALPVDAVRLRARVTDAPGLIAFAFDDRALAVPTGEAAVATPTTAFGAAAPALDLAQDADAFSLRYAGQVRIDAAGSYTFAVDVGADASDGFRLWIDGAVVASQWTSLMPAASATLTLAPGWHDLLLDYSEDTGGATLALSLEGPGIPAGPIAADRLRPAVAFGLTASHVGLTPTALGDATANGPTTTAVTSPLTGPAGAVIDAIDLGLGIANQRMSDLSADVRDCHGSTPLPLPASPGYLYLAARTDCAGTTLPPPTTWGFRVTDTVVGNDVIYAASTPALYLPAIIATYHGGDRLPFAPALTFVSTPRPMPGATAWGPVALIADLRGAALALEVRTADDEVALASATWVPVADGEVPQGRPGALVQYRLTLSSSGWELPTIDRVAISYRTDVP